MKAKTTIAKYFFSFIITVLTLKTTGNGRYVMASCVELGLIVLVSDVIIRRKKILGIAANILFCLFYNAQMMVLFFGNSYIQPVMLSNLESIEDLGGNAAAYITAAALAVTFSLLPVQVLHFKKKIFQKKTGYLISFVCLIEVILVFSLGVEYSPIYGYIRLGIEEYKLRQMRQYMNGMDDSADAFYVPEVADYRQKDIALPKRPNVILIFTEGLSQSIVEDKRNIMPNAAQLEARSLNFTGYYNHTFATYRGLSGQLYSGYQLDDQDENQLISIQDIFRMNQYHTVFINTEPMNNDFTAYVNAFKFDEVIGDASGERNGKVDSYSDKEAYELLYDTACQLSENQEPFFEVIYTFGTHVSFDSVDEKFGDGTDRVLNKFYNVDRQLGDFLKKFESGELADNTIIIFTTDHAAYQDADFMNAFPNHKRVSAVADEIPLCIYYKGILPETYDVDGRNSLGLAPTILDYLDISEPNYFLGTSLFSAEGDKSPLETIFNVETALLNTDGGKVAALDNNSVDKVEEQIRQYFVAKMQDNPEKRSQEMENLFKTQIKTVISEDGNFLEVTYIPKKGEEYQQVWFPIWSTLNDQDDIVRYCGEQNEDGSWHVMVDLSQHTEDGELNIHVYGGDYSATDRLAYTTIWIK